MSTLHDLIREQESLRRARVGRWIDAEGQRIGAAFAEGLRAELPSVRVAVEQITRRLAEEQRLYLRRMHLRSVLRLTWRQRFRRWTGV